MLSFSTLENTVVQYLQQHHIYSPNEIDLDKIADIESIFVYYLGSPSTSRNFNGMASIVVNTGNPSEQQRVEFAHELGHIFRNHGSHQAFANEMFVELQEWQANKFSMYLLCPTFMLMEQLDKHYSPAHLAKTFRVPELFMEQRLKLLENQRYSSWMERQLDVVMESSPKYGRDYHSTWTVGRIEYFCDATGKILFHRKLVDY